MDKSILLGQVGGSAETAILVLDEFVNQTPTDVVNIGKCLGEQDLVAAGKVAHSLKGSSGVFGAETLRQIAADLEMACREGNKETSQSLFEQLAAEAKRCLEFVPQLKADLK